MSRGTLDTACGFPVSCTRLSLSLAGFPKTLPLPSRLLFAVLNPGRLRLPVWAPPLSLAATYGIDVSFSSSGYLDVSVPRVPLHMLFIHLWIVKVPLTGFPHSDICGSQDICSSPQLFAAYHVFLRLLVPRHPPCALIRLTFMHPYLRCTLFRISALSFLYLYRLSAYGLSDLFFSRIPTCRLPPVLFLDVLFNLWLH